ncbi:hypothetical protein GVN18_22480 [Pseudomonas sp. ODNR1LW]|nr:hypothetical protein [Pseudomonas sp. ODNR1LW]
MDSTDGAEAQREATATIRGYSYQFDASILAVLEANADENVTVEGVEDFDISTATTDTHGQVKYYEAQKLTDAKLRDAVLPMLKGFLSYPPDKRGRKRYVLYGYFKETPTYPPIDLAVLKRILVQRCFLKEAGDNTKKKKVETNLQIDLGASDSDLTDFATRFEIRITERIEEHRARVVAKLSEAQGVTKIEAEGYSYPSAFTAMAELSMKRSREARTITRKVFLKAIKPDVAIYSAWMLREESETAFCRRMRERHFSALNIESKDRFFILTLADGDGVDDVWQLTQHIIDRWSSHKMSRKPLKERYAPFFFFPRLGAQDLAELKGRLVSAGHTITDGHAYNQAPFSIQHLMLPQTQDRPVSARFVATADQLLEALAAANLRKFVVQLHTGDAHSVDPSIPQIAIPITSASMARKIL